ncbi:hypothetical protein BGZ67_010730 [Mortierella alpina]|nr:hypothetical protein BGZ67_010730 [Mortierella alpina]
MDRTDLAFYKTQKIWEDLIFIANYNTLHDKVFKTMTLLNNTYKEWSSISKMDDDALVDIRSLRAVLKIQLNTYMGIIYTNSYAKGFDITYATGHYYTMGQKAVHCVLEHKTDYYGLNTPAEDATIGRVI